MSLTPLETPSLEKVDGKEDINTVPPSDGVADIKAKFDYKMQAKLLRRIDLHVMPWLILAYLIKNLDGNAISYVKTLNAGTDASITAMLNMTTDQYAWLSTIFMIPFILVEIPSNALMKWSGPRVHFCRIIGLWSIAAMCQAAAKNFAGIMTARFFLTVYSVPRPIWMIFVCSVSVVCFALMAVVTSQAALYAIICIVSIPISWNDNILVSWRTQSLKGATHAAFVFAFQNAFGQLASLYTAQIFQDKYAPRYVVPFAVSCGFWGLMIVLTFWLWKLTYRSERDTRLFAQRRHKLGKETNQILEDDYELRD